MYDDPQSIIAKAKNRIEQLRELQEGFVSHLRSYPEAEEVSSRIEVENNDLIVGMLGFASRAKPRVVTDGKDYYLEYVFLVSDGESQVETARFYLGANGRVGDDISTGNYLFDFDNIYAAREMCTRIGLGILRSKLFSPA